MQKNNVGGIFFTEKDDDFGPLFNEFNIYIRSLDKDLGIKEQDIFNLTDVPDLDTKIQALDSYSSTNLTDLQVHFRALNEAFDKVEKRIQLALDALII